MSGKMSKEEILGIIRELISEQLNIEISRVTPAANFTEDLDADSLDVVELVMAVEEKFDIEIEDAAASTIAKVEDVLDYIYNNQGTGTKKA